MGGIFGIASGGLAINSAVKSHRAKAPLEEARNVLAGTPVVEDADTPHGAVANVETGLKDKVIGYTTAPSSRFYNATTPPQEVKADQVIRRTHISAERARAYMNENGIPGVVARSGTFFVPVKAEGIDAPLFEPRDPYTGPPIQRKPKYFQPTTPALVEGSSGDIRFQRSVAESARADILYFAGDRSGYKGAAVVFGIASAALLGAAAFAARAEFQD
jgi:hypothetical protein